MKIEDFLSVLVNFRKHFRGVLLFLPGIIKCELRNNYEIIGEMLAKKQGLGTVGVSDKKGQKYCHTDAFMTFMKIKRQWE